MILSRLFIGVGEAAYGSVGLAVVLAVFPGYRRAAFTRAFLMWDLTPTLSGQAAWAGPSWAADWHQPRRSRATGVPWPSAATAGR